MDAYIYFYPLITMDVTRKQLTNTEPGKGGLGGPMNTFANAAAFPAADFKAVVRPNFDTLYSSAISTSPRSRWSSPVPDTGGRYYLLPMLDMWSDVFASPGWRTTGTQAGNFLVTPPGWSGTVPRASTRIDAPTPYVWIIGRTKTDGPPDYDAVHKIQAGFKITPLSEWNKPANPVAFKLDPSVDMKTPPKIQVDTMPAGQYFAYAAELLKLQPPHITDQPIVAQMKRIGIEPGKSFDIGKVDPGSAEGAGKCAGSRAEAHGLENGDARPRRERLVDEYRHDGRLRQLLSQARHRRATRPRREPAGGCNLSAQSRRRIRQAARRRQQIHDQFRKGLRHRR